MISTNKTFLASAFVVAALSSQLVFAAGAEEKPEMSPTQEAIASYNDGIGLRDRAAKLDEQMADADADRKERLMKEQQGLFEKAVGKYQKAIEVKPTFAEAHGSLGYALRRLGRYEEAMTAYDKSLELNPNYPEAMEYRAEALLGLGRVAEAQEAYKRLTMVSPEHAGQLLTAMKAWAADEGNASVDGAADLVDWLSHQAELTAATGAAQGSASSWR